MAGIRSGGVKRLMDSRSPECSTLVMKELCTEGGEEVMLMVDDPVQGTRPVFIPGDGASHMIHT